MSELLKINVNEHTEKKNGLTYLSWAWAWAEVLKVDPSATWVASAPGLDGPALFLPDGSALVGVTVTIKDHPKGCLLPVMDHRNKAIKNPDAFAINTAIMRCLAKAIAMHGLGLYIYAGEDMPEPATGMDPSTLQDWLQAIEQCTDDALEAMTRDGMAAAQEVRDREAWIAIRDARNRRKAAA